MTSYQIAAEIVLFLFAFLNIGFWRFNVRQLAILKKEGDDLTKMQDDIASSIENLKKANEINRITLKKIKEVLTRPNNSNHTKT